jgi:D-alanyl-D-alanine carboxypeptidase (penicillin-binding protein 5/6)
MNQKAESLGCTQTHFITPNGLDATDDTGTHSTTARELALIMAYCIQNEDFLDITTTSDFSFSSYKSKNGELTKYNSYNVTNANAFLNMYDNIISGKTGFTGNAGYCYVCAYRCDGRTFIVALLACGWPSNKTYKWKDTRLLLNWARQNFFLTEILTENFSLNPISVTDGFSDSTNVHINGTYSLLLSKNDVVNVVMNIPEKISAPVNSGDVVGNVCVYVNDSLMYTTPVYADSSIKQLDYLFFLKKVIKLFTFIDK